LILILVSDDPVPDYYDSVASDADVVGMRSFWFDPYLWVHLTGIAALPIFLEICLLGLAAGDPVLPAVLELLFVAAVGIVPVFWMQWQRPFYIFSLLAIALQPTQLSLEQRRLLRLFKTKEVRVLTAIAPIVLAIALWQLYKLAPLAAEVTPLAGQWRLVGLLLAAIAFLACNLFLQVPLSVVRVLLAREAELAAIDPYPLEQIGRDFTVLGLRVKQILPAIASPSQPVAAAESVAPSETPIAPTSPEAIASNPAPTDSAPTDSAPTDSAPTDPALTDSAPVDPTSADLAVTAEASAEAVVETAAEAIAATEEAAEAAAQQAAPSEAVSQVTKPHSATDSALPETTASDGQAIADVPADADALVSPEVLEEADSVDRSPDAEAASNSTSEEES
jgi:hypothetical protein